MRLGFVPADDALYPLRIPHRQLGQRTRDDLPVLELREALLKFFAEFVERRRQFGAEFVDRFFRLIGIKASGHWLGTHSWCLMFLVVLKLSLVRGNSSPAFICWISA